MNGQVYWMLEVEIQPGKLAEFRAVAGDLIVQTQAEPDTLDYEWNISADEKTCHIFERYRDSAATLAHVAGSLQHAERLLASSRLIRCSVYGDPSDEVRGRLADLKPAYFSELGGFSR